MRSCAKSLALLFMILCASNLIAGNVYSQAGIGPSPDETHPSEILGQADEDLVDPPVAPLTLFGPCFLQLGPPINCPVSVISGRNVYRREAPWQAQIFAATVAAEYSQAVLRTYPLWELNHICGGALIDSNWIVTAAHCVLDGRFNKRSARIRLGTNDVSVDDGRSFSINRVVVHQDYNARTRLNDIAMIRITGDLSFDADRRNVIASIPLHGTLAVGPRLEPWQSFSVTGWGVTSTGPISHASALLQKLALRRVPNDLCRQSLRGGFTRIDDSVLCAEADEGDACQGDSGGPLTVEFDDASGKDPIAILVGVVSWGKGCALKGKPGVYTRITSHLNWIRRAMGSAPHVVSLR